MKARLVGTILMVVLVCGLVAAQDKPAAPSPVATTAAPTLSSEDALKLDNLVLRSQLLQEQVARRRAELSLLEQQQKELQEEAQKTLADLQRPGYTLDVQTRKYVPVPAEKPPEKPAPKK